MPSLSHFHHHKYKTNIIQTVIAINDTVKMQKLIQNDKENLLYLAIGHSIKAIDLNKNCFVK